jgi:threonine aldolase
MNPKHDVHYPLTQLISIEDTSNRGGGAIYDFEEIKNIKKFCAKQGLPLHLDGARVFNALVENNIDYKEYAQQFDSISVCLSKGLGAPIGSLLIGDADFIENARRVRKVFGGGMRQAGFIAAGGLYALKNNVLRLKDDHNGAKKIEKKLLEMPWVDHVLEVETNIVVCILKDSSRVNEFVNKFEANDILIMPFGKGMLRMVTHLDISQDDILAVCTFIESLE